ncbi:MAG: oligosaccharide flippase family protein [Acidimicrobiia bacterium]|nr:oligosaccharide flippase family protein [Acidimicrobiia bacterium]
MAIGGYGVWALVAQQLATGRGHGRRAVAGESVAAEVAILGTARSEELLSYSAGSSLGGLANFANSRSDALLIGLLMGPVAVGLYRLAARFTEIVVDLFTRSIQQVALPELSRYQDDAVRFRRRSLSVLSSTSVITLPMLGVLAGVSGPLLDLVGEEWTPAVTGLRILCVADGDPVGVARRCRRRPGCRSALRQRSIGLARGGRQRGRIRRGGCRGA